MSVSSAPPRRRGRFFTRALLYLIAATAVLLLIHMSSLSSPRSAARHALRHAFRVYSRLLHYYPLLTRAVTTSCIMLLADLLGQLLSPTTRGIDVYRLLRYSSYGLLILGPFLHVWYLVMAAFGPEDDLDGSVTKALFEQFTMEPTTIFFYISYDGLLQRRGFRATLARVRAELPSLWIKNCIFWLPANFSNYYIGTPELRVLFANLCSLFWNTYFTLKVNAVATANPSISAPNSPPPPLIHSANSSIGNANSTASSSVATQRKPAQDPSISSSLLQTSMARISEKRPARPRASSGDRDRRNGSHYKLEPATLLPLVSEEKASEELSPSNSAPALFLASSRERDECKSVTPAVVIV